MASFWHMRRAVPQARAAGDFFVGALHIRYNAVWRTRERYIAMFSYPLLAYVPYKVHKGGPS